VPVKLLCLSLRTYIKRSLRLNTLKRLEQARRSLAGKAAFKVLLEKGALGAGVLFTPDCRATFEELKTKGVGFKGEPKEQFYGIEAILVDGVGNWFSMSQPK
jgi:hypothetical protein